MAIQFFFCVLTLITAPGKSWAADRNQVPRDRDTIRVPLNSDPEKLDPAWVTSPATMSIVRQMFDGLVELNENHEPQSALAQSWQISADKRTYTFKLRPNLTFHNGSPVTAQDVKASFERAAFQRQGWIFSGIKGFKPPPKPTIGGAPQKIEIPDIPGITVQGDEVRIELNQPNEAFLSMLAHPGAFVVARGTEPPVGTGAFKLRSNKRGDSTISLGYFPGHFSISPSGIREGCIKQVKFLVLPDDQSRIYAYDTGLIHLTDIPEARIRNFAETRPKEFKQWPTYGVFGLRLNTKEPPLNDLKVRQAIAKAIDVDLLRKALLEDAYGRLDGVLPSNLREKMLKDAGQEDRGTSDPERVKRQEFDPVAAKTLVDQYMGKDGPPPHKPPPRLTLHTILGHNLAKTMAEAIHDQLTKVGFEVTIEQSDLGVLMAKARAGQAKFFIAGINPSYPDPNAVFAPNFHSKFKGALNLSQFDSKAVDESLNAAAKLPPGEERNKIYSAIEQELIDQAVWIPLARIEGLALVKPYVHGLKTSPRAGAFALQEPLRTVCIGENPDIDTRIGRPGVQ